MGTALVSFVQWRNDFTLRPHLPALRARELSRTQHSLPVLKRIEECSSHPCDACNTKSNSEKTKRRSPKTSKKLSKLSNGDANDRYVGAVICSNEKSNKYDNDDDEGDDDDRSDYDKESVMSSRGNAIIIESAHHDMLEQNEEVGNRFSKCTHYTIPGEKILCQSVEVENKQVRKKGKMNDNVIEKDEQITKMSECVDDNVNTTLHNASINKNINKMESINEERKKDKDYTEYMFKEDDNELGPWDCVDGAYHLTSSSSAELYRRLDSATYRAAHVASLDDASWFARYQNGLKYINTTHLPHSTGFLWDYKRLTSHDSSFVSLTHKMQQVCAQPELINEEAIGWRGVNHVGHKVSKTFIYNSSTNNTNNNKLSKEKNKTTVYESTNKNCNNANHISSSSSSSSSCNTSLPQNENLKLSSNVIFYMNPAQYWTYHELWSKIIFFASGLHFLGIRPGSFVIILDDNRWEWLVSCHACWALGAIVLTSPYAIRSLHRLAEDTLYDKVKLVIGQEHHVNVVQCFYKEVWREREHQLKEVEVSNIAMSKILNYKNSESELVSLSEYTYHHEQEEENHIKDWVKLDGHIPKAIITSELLQNNTKDYSNDCKENKCGDKHKATRAALWWSDVIALGERQLLQPWQHSMHNFALEHTQTKSTKSHKHKKQSSETNKENNAYQEEKELECFTGELYPLRASDLAMIVYTEGEAKGVTLTHGALVASATGYLLSFEKMQLNEKEYDEEESELFEEEEQQQQQQQQEEEEEEAEEQKFSESETNPQLEKMPNREIRRKNRNNETSFNSERNNIYKNQNNNNITTSMVNYQGNNYCEKDDVTSLHKYKNIIRAIYSSSAMRYLKVGHRFLSALLKPIHASSFLNYWSQRRCEMNALSSRHHFSALPAVSFIPHSLSPSPYSTSSSCVSATSVGHSYYKSEFQQQQQQQQKWHKRRRKQWEWNSEPNSYQRPTLLTYQPLHHVMELILQNIFLFQGYLVCYGSESTLISGQVHPCGDLVCFRPQLFTTFPNFLSELKESIETSIEPGYRQLLFDVGYEARQVALRRQLETPFLNSFIFRQLRTLLGNRCKLILSTHAPLEASVQEFMQVVCGVSVVQCYSSNVLAGSGLMQYYWSNELHSIGHLCDGSLEVKLRPCNRYNSEENNKINNTSNVLCGELLLRGPAMMSGYYRQEEVTAYEMENYYTDNVYTMNNTIGKKQCYYHHHEQYDNTEDECSDEANSQHSFNNVKTINNNNNNSKVCNVTKENYTCAMNGGWWHSGDIVERRSHCGFRVIDRLLQPPSYTLYETNLQSHHTENQFHHHHRNNNNNSKMMNNNSTNNNMLYPTLATHTITVNPVGRVGKCKLRNGHTICLSLIEEAYEMHPLALIGGVCVMVHPHSSLLCALVLTSEAKLMKFIQSIRDDYYGCYDSDDNIVFSSKGKSVGVSDDSANQGKTRFANMEYLQNGKQKRNSNKIDKKNENKYVRNEYKNINNINSSGSSNERTKQLFKLISRIDEQNLRWPFVLREAALHKAASYSFYDYGQMHLCNTSPFFLEEHEFICHVRLLYDEWTIWNKCRTRTGRINRETIALRYEGVIAELFADMLKNSK